MFFFFCLSVAIYFGLLSAGNVRFAVRMPGPNSRYLAIVLHGIILLTLFGYMGIYFCLYEYGYQPIFHWFCPVNYRGPIMQGYFLPYLLLALTILGTYGCIAARGLQKVGSKLRADHWSLSTIYTAALFSLTIAGLLYRTMDHFAKADLLEEQAQIKQQLESVYSKQPPESENAWSVYQTIVRDDDAFRVFHTLPLKNEDLLTFVGKYSIADSELQAAKPLTLKLRAASRFSLCKLPGKTKYVGPSANFRVSGIFSELARWLNLLHYDACVQAAQGNPQESVQDIVAMWRLSEHCAQDMDSDNYTLSFRLEHCTATAVEYLLSKHQLPPRELEKLLKYVPAERQATLTRAIERESMRTRYFQIERYLDEDFKLEDFDSTNGWPGWGRLFFAQYDLRTQEQMEKLQIADSRLSQRKLRFFDQPPDYQRLCNSGLLSRDSYFDVRVCTWKSETLRAEARMRLTQVGIAAYLFALQEGRFPQSLEELRVIGFTLNVTDPCTGELFKIVHQNDKLTFYSIGEDRRDDQSVVDSETFWKDDIHFTIHLPPN